MPHIPGYHLHSFKPVCYVQEHPDNPGEMIRNSKVWFRGATHVGFLFKRSLRERPAVNVGPQIAGLFKVGTFLN